MEELLQIIKWEDVLKSVNYLYGSQIHYEGEKVYFENLNFASGKIIKLWKSRTNYQGDRTTPDLPILENGQGYRLVSHYQTKPANRVLVQLDFYNRQNELLETKILRNQETEFHYPEDAFAYTISLINSGCQSLEFSNLSLYQIDGKAKNILLTNEREGFYEDNHFPNAIAFVKSIINDEN